MFKMFLTTLVLTVFTFADGPVLKTGQTTSYAQFDDGFYQMGKARSYSRSAAGVVADHTTGLEWQDDVDSVQKPWVTQKNYDNGNYDDTSGDTATTYCRDLTLDGGGWRLPSIKELETLVDSSKDDPSVAENVFHRISSSGYWSTATYADYTSSAWVVHFSYGNSGSYTKDSNGYVRCVRVGQLQPSNFSRDDVTEIVTDSTTGLQWQDDEIVKTTDRTWSEAIDYCENDMVLGGHNDWRLPNKNELLSIIDRLRYHPAIDVTYFINTALNYYWSSTTLASHADYAWTVNFDYGFSGNYNKGNNCYVRCVRGGQFDISASLPPVIMYLLD